MPPSPFRLRTATEMWSQYVTFHTRSPFKLHAISVVGLVTFPAYYVVWTWLLPQPYENGWLRTIGFGLSLAGACQRYWPKFLKPYFLSFSYLAVLYGLPTFFTAMTLLNGASAVWLMSLMSAFLFVALLYDIANAVLVSLVGSILGYLLYTLLSHSYALPADYLASIPILLFTVLAILTLSYNEQQIANEKWSAAHVLASHIAHEMRTHLLGIRFDCEQAQLMFQEMTGQAIPENHQASSSRALEIAQLKRALTRIDAHASTANLVIEMLLANVTLGRVKSTDFSVHGLDNVIHSAIERYTLDPNVRSSITVSGATETRFFGSDILMLHVFFNLLKNSLTAIEFKGSGEIEISVRETESAILIVFRDTGSGIAPDLLPLIFMPFVTSGRRMQGTGLGLSFCKLVVESFGGEISCKSELGLGTEFEIRLPRVLEQPNRAPGSAASAVAARS